MKRNEWWLGAMAVVLAGGLLAACSKKQVVEGGGVTQIPSATATTEAGGATGAPREQTLSPSSPEGGRATAEGGQSGAAGASSSTSSEAPPKELAGLVEKRGPDVLKPSGSTPGSAEPVAGLSRVHFDFDQSALTAAAKSTLEKNAKFLTANPGLRIRVEGHCDERGTTEYNIALGERRAKATSQYLTDLGIDPNRMGVTSYGKEVPLDPGHDEAAWAKNRRAEFVKFQ